MSIALANELRGYMKDMDKGTENGYIESAYAAADLKTKIDAFEARNIVGWEKTLRSVEDFANKLISLKDKNALTGGDAYAIYKKACLKLKENGCPDSILAKVTKEEEEIKTSKTGVITRRDVLGATLAEKEGKVVPVVDVLKFQQQVSALITNVNRLEILKAVAKNTAEQNFWDLIMEMLKIEESYDLIGILSARMLVPLEYKKTLDMNLANVTVLCNKGGKLSNGLVSLGGFLGLATVKSEPILAHAMKLIRNPLLNEDPLEFRCVKKIGENTEAFRVRKIEAENSYATYRSIMVGMKIHAEFYTKLDTAIKGKIKQSVLKYTVEG